MIYRYKYPMPSVTADCVVTRRRRGRLELLLIRRGKAPFKGRWALPGGFVEPGETLEAAARRELAEETGVRAGAVRQVGVFGDPGRDPRGWVVAVAFLMRAKPGQARGSDDASDARWFSAAKLPRLAFDHRKISAAALGRKP